MTIRPSRRQTWTWPIAVAVISLAGLVTALVGDGAWDAASWIALGWPLVLCVWFGWIKRSGLR